MEEHKDLGPSLIDSVGKPLIDEIGSDLSEVLLDSLLKDGLLKDIPIVGTILGMSKAAIRLKDYLFIKKVLKFLTDLSSISFEEKEGFLKKYEGTDEAGRLGETLILYLDRHENLKKPEFLAKIFKAYIRNRLTNTQFHFLATAIDRAITQDIETFVMLFQQEYDLQKHGDYYQLNKLKLQKQNIAKNLYSAGLANIDLEIERGKSLGQALSNMGISEWSGEPANIKQLQVSFVLKPEAELLAKAILDLWE